MPKTKALDEFISSENVEEKENDNTDEEKEYVSAIVQQQLEAASFKKGGTSSDSSTGSGFGLYEELDQVWQDEYALYKGGGLQWSTSLAYRNQSDRKRRPNSEDNFIFTTINIITANITNAPPEMTVDSMGEEYDEKIDKINNATKFNDSRNKFYSKWKKMVFDFVAYGPIIGFVGWDNDWIGGRGDKRWVGDVKIDRVDKREFFPDSSIVDLEGRLQECSYIHRRLRKKIDWIKKRFPKYGKNINQIANDEDLQTEGGSDHDQTYLIERWERGKPKFINNDRKKDLLIQAEMYRNKGDHYKSIEYEEMAKGTFDGIHVCYFTQDGVFLEYTPYVYDHGKYPFVFKNRYYDENSAWGWGEIRNIKIPQIMHNKADEIELEAMLIEGLGGGFYNNNAIDPIQIKQIKDRNGRGGEWFQVNNVEQIKERTGPKIPNSITNYKNHKQGIIENVSTVSATEKGIAPSGQTPYRSLALLSGKSDVKVQQATDILEDFLTELHLLRIELMAQFYTEDRYYSVKGSDGKPVTGTINRDDMMEQWDREIITDEEGNVIEKKTEFFIPEFDVSVNIMDSKPTSRDYYTQTAMNMHAIQGMTIQDVWETLENGKFPPKEQIMENLEMQNQIMALMNNISTMPEEQQAQVMQLLSQLGQQQQGQQQGAEQQMQPQQI